MDEKLRKELKAIGNKRNSKHFSKESKKVHRKIAGMMKYNKKSVVDERVVDKLEEAFSMGCNVGEACILANISRERYNSFVDKNPMWGQRVEFLKDTMIRKAKQVINEALDNGDVQTARWYLEKKRREEFGNEVKISGKLDIKQAIVDWAKVIDTDSEEVKPLEIEAEEVKQLEFTGENDGESQG